MYLGEWKNAYPEAKIIGMEGLPEKKKAERWAFFGCKYLFAVTRLIGLSPCQLIAYGIDPPAATYGFENDVSSQHIIRYHLDKHGSYYRFNLGQQSLIIVQTLHLTILMCVLS